MEERVLEKEKLRSLLEKFINEAEVVGVCQRKGKYVYEKLESPDEFCPDFDVTCQSPKRYIFPPREDLLRFALGEKIAAEALFDDKFRVIWGVHPYDIKAINIVDLMFESTNKDKHYLQRRQNTFIVGIDPLRASEKSFWHIMEADKVDRGFDLMLTDIGEEYIITVGTERAKNFLDRFGVSERAGEAKIEKREKVRENLKYLCPQERKLNFSLEALPYLLMRASEAPLWKEKAEKCFSCGSCNLVCPTCYCFDVQDWVSEDLTEGKRYRLWDGCLLQDFAVVATGENFRKERYQRYRHRFYRKGLYIKKEYGVFACVGCGRCGISCLSEIADPVEVYNEVFNYVKGAVIL